MTQSEPAILVPQGNSLRRLEHKPVISKPLASTMFLAREIFELEKCKLDGRPSGFGVPYRFYVGIKTEFFDFIEQNRTFDSLGEDLGSNARLIAWPDGMVTGLS
jgi:hypothetical protein